MRTTINSYDPTVPIVEGAGRPSELFLILLRQLEERGLIIGTGSPEGTIEAQQGREYMDETGVAGAVKYIKQQADIAGDRTRGWVAI